MQEATRRVCKQVQLVCKWQELGFFFHDNKVHFLTVVLLTILQLGDLYFNVPRLEKLLLMQANLLVECGTYFLPASLRPTSTI